MSERATELLHLLVLDSSAMSVEDRAMLVPQLLRLEQVPDTRVSVVPNPLRDGFTVLLVTVDGQQGLADYRAHPVHLEVASRLRASGVTNIKAETGTADLRDHLNDRSQ